MPTPQIPQRCAICGSGAVTHVVSDCNTNPSYREPTRFVCESHVERAEDEMRDTGASIDTMTIAEYLENEGE